LVDQICGGMVSQIVVLHRSYYLKCQKERFEEYQDTRHVFQKQKEEITRILFYQVQELKCWWWCFMVKENQNQMQTSSVHKLRYQSDQTQCWKILYTNAETIGKNQRVDKFFQ
jgi:hypothetical protein